MKVELTDAAEFVRWLRDHVEEAERFANEFPFLNITRWQAKAEVYHDVLQRFMLLEVVEDRCSATTPLGFQCERERDHEGKHKAHWNEEGDLISWITSDSGLIRFLGEVS